MAFFNLTHLGSQNPVKRIPLLKEAGSDNASVESSSRKKVHEAASLIKHDDGRHEKLSSLTSLQYNNGMYNTSYQGSHKIYEELRTKHSRNLEGPLNLYQYPVVSSQNYGWFLKYGYQPWTQNEQHVHVNSEMTRFVDEMTASNKGFSLF